MLPQWKLVKTGTVPCDSDGWLHSCDDGSCIYDRTVCDGVKDCPDGSDEKPYDSQSEGFECTVKSTMKKCLLPQDYVCDQYNHCLEDECNCSRTYPFQCSSEECVDIAYFCDGMKDCVNGEDELPYRNKYEGVRCPTEYNNSACSLPVQYKCDGKRNCVTGGDECFCGAEDETALFDETCFRCLNGDGEMLLSHVCDGFYDCPDMSDECLCENPPSTCKQLTYRDQCEFKCKSNYVTQDTEICITKDRICDGARDCPLGEDEKYCPFVLTQKKTIQNSYKEEMPEFWCCNAGYPADCLYEDTFTNETYDGCDQFYHCPQDPNYASYLNYAIKCDGVPTCTGLYDECVDCPGSESRPYCNSDDPYGFVCPNSARQFALFAQDICDGIAHCNSNSPLDSADEKTCEGRFQCFADIAGVEHISVPQSSCCDCNKDCRDGSDEKNCSSFSKFCCSNGDQGVAKDVVCDGVEDCSDGSDECQSCIDSPFADDKHLISNVGLRAFVWIIGVLSSAGNVYVLAETAATLFGGKQNALGKITSYHVIALAVADLCVGLYLIALGVVDSIYAGVYCYQEKLWRSGRFCNIMGVLSTFGLEASVLMLTLMTINRLRIVFRPFKQPSVWRSLLAIAVALICALLLAIIPVLPTVQDYFTSYVRFQDNPFLRREISRSEMSALANKMASLESFGESFQKTHGYQNSDGLQSWRTLFDLMIHLNDSFTPKYQFGYYSSHGVCLPKLFPTRNDPTWEYSIALIVLNFSSFITILISYICLYRRAIKTRKKAKVNGGDDSQQTLAIQRRITRIVVTDFLCWIPICFLAFLKLLGVPVSDIVYAVAAIVILPINSAINPFLYSNLPEVIWSRAGRAYSRFYSDSGGKSNETGNTELDMLKRKKNSTNKTT